MGCQNARVQQYFGVYKENEILNTGIPESKILRNRNIRTNDLLLDKVPTHQDCETLIDILQYIYLLNGFRTTVNRNIHNPFLGTRQKNGTNNEYIYIYIYAKYSGWNIGEIQMEDIWGRIQGDRELRTRLSHPEYVGDLSV